jgi:hypothetical protein
MPEERAPMRIAVRFPSYASAHWRERCLAALSAAGPVEITCLSTASVASPADLVLDWSTQPLDARQLALANKLGYWTFVYGARPERIEPGLQEFLDGTRAAYARLVRLDQPDSGRVLREGAVKTVGHSLRATRERLLDAVVDWPGRVLQERLGQTQDATRPRDTELPAVRWRQRRIAGRLSRQFQIVCAGVRNVVKRLAGEITREHWAVGVIAAPVQQVCQSFDPGTIRWLPAPADGFLADPFGRVMADGRLIILAEALSWQDGRGRIVAFESRPDGTVSAPQELFAFDTHASYPQLIEHDGGLYCIPETLAQRRVQLFKADPFPHRWIPDTVLLENFPGADATVVLHGDRWWMFAGNHDDQDEAKLFIFHAADLRGPWLPHAANPVKCDLRSARPAGPLFILGEDLCRPAQDCSVTYGGAVVINKIERLSPTEFVERPFTRLAPAPSGPYPHGLHTLSAAGNLTLVDGKRQAMSAGSLLVGARSLYQKLNRKSRLARRPTPHERP